jgi:hypothetical protein
MKMNYSIPVAILIMVLGLVIIGTAVISPMLEILELKIALALAGAAFVSSGVMQLGQAQEKKRADQKLEQIMDKLDKIEQELEKVESPRGTGVAIADVISSGLKYYAEHMTKPEKEEEND